MPEPFLLNCSSADVVVDAAVAVAAVEAAAVVVAVGDVVVGVAAAAVGFPAGLSVELDVYVSPIPWPLLT